MIPTTPLTTADLDARDRTLPVPRAALAVVDARSLALAIARSIWPLVETLDTLTAEERAAVHPALDAIHARLQVAYQVVDEAADLAEGA